MSWEVEYTDDFGSWWEELTAGEQEDIAFVVRLLEERGPQLGHPYSSKIESSKHAHMRELRAQHQGRRYRVLYAFDPRRIALYLSVTTRPETTAGTMNMCRSLTGSMTNTSPSMSLRKKEDSAMAKKFRDLYERMPADARKRVETRVEQALKEMPLQELREARHLTQQQLAERLKSGQAAVSKLERRTDMYVSTLRRFIEAMGGELEIIARFPDGDVRVTNFADDASQSTAA